MSLKLLMFIGIIWTNGLMAKNGKVRAPPPPPEVLPSQKDSHIKSIPVVEKKKEFFNSMVTFVLPKNHNCVESATEIKCYSHLESPPGGKVFVTIKETNNKKHFTVKEYYKFLTSHKKSDQKNYTYNPKKVMQGGNWIRVHPKDEGKGSQLYSQFLTVNGNKLITIDIELPGEIKKAKQFLPFEWFSILMPQIDLYRSYISRCKNLKVNKCIQLRGMVHVEKRIGRKRSQQKTFILYPEKIKIGEGNKKQTDLNMNVDRSKKYKIKYVAKSAKDLL